MAEERSEDKRAEGTVKWFDPEKGYGFIERPFADEDVFVHIADVQRSGIERLYEGQQVEFTLQKTPKGFQAVDLEFQEVETPAPPQETLVGEEIPMADVFYGATLSMFEDEHVSPVTCVLWEETTLQGMDPGFRIDMGLAGRYEDESPQDYFERRLSVLESLASLAELKLAFRAVERKLREARE